mmetsp:Transcript_5590/g.9061  ORF Transcript_5590/g.9061 Transcript_5590/m.9061 type:complete len:222 (+) Transcript_5590:743-1408(+)
MGVNLRRLHVATELGDIEPDLFGHADDARLFRAALHPHQGPVEFLVLALFARGQRGAGSKDRPLAEDRPLPVDQFDVRIFGEQRFDLWFHSAAIGTVVVEELDHGHIAIRVAEDRRVRIVLQNIPVVRQHACRRCRLALLFALFDDLNRLEHNLGVLANGLEHQLFHPVLTQRVSLRGQWQCHYGEYRHHLGDLHSNSPCCASRLPSAQLACPESVRARLI